MIKIQESQSIPSSTYAYKWLPNIKWNWGPNNINIVTLGGWKHSHITLHIIFQISFDVFYFIYMPYFKENIINLGAYYLISLVTSQTILRWGLAHRGRGKENHMYQLVILAGSPDFWNLLHQPVPFLKMITTSFPYIENLFHSSIPEVLVLWENIVLLPKSLLISEEYAFVFK